MISAELFEGTEKEYRNIDLPSYSLISDFLKGNINAKRGAKSDSERDLNIFFELGSIVDYCLSESVSISQLLNGGRIEIVDDKIFYNSKKYTEIKNLILFFRSSKDEEEKRELKRVINEICKSDSDISSFVKQYVLALNKKRDNPNVFLLTKFFLKKTEITFKRMRSLVDRTIVRGDNVSYQKKIIINVNGRRYKTMFDLFVVNHSLKTFYIADMKTTSKSSTYVENVFFDSVYSYNYYLQSALYSLAGSAYGKKEFPGYEFTGFKFLACSSANDKTDLRIPGAANTGTGTYFLKNKSIKDIIRGFNYYSSTGDLYSCPSVIEIIKSFEENSLLGNSEKEVLRSKEIINSLASTKNTIHPLNNSSVSFSFSGSILKIEKNDNPTPISAYQDFYFNFSKEICFTALRKILRESGMFLSITEGEKPSILCKEFLRRGFIDFAKKHERLMDLNTEFVEMSEKVRNFIKDDSLPF